MKPIAKFFASGFLCGMAVVLAASGIRDLQNPPPNLPPSVGTVTTKYSDGGIIGGMSACKPCHDAFYGDTQDE
jgi:hypothetical protein